MVLTWHLPPLNKSVCGLANASLIPKDVNDPYVLKFESSITFYTFFWLSVVLPLDFFFVLLTVVTSDD